VLTLDERAPDAVKLRLLLHLSVERTRCSLLTNLLLVSHLRSTLPAALLLVQAHPTLTVLPVV